NSRRREFRRVKYTRRAKWRLRYLNFSRSHLTLSPDFQTTRRYGATPSPTPQAQRGSALYQQPNRSHFAASLQKLNDRDGRFAREQVRPDLAAVDSNKKRFPLLARYRAKPAHEDFDLAPLRLQGQIHPKRRVGPPARRQIQILYSSTTLANLVPVPRLPH